MIKGRGGRGAVWVGDRVLAEQTSQAIVNHSPDGFSWGYAGSGPAQFALALLLYFGVTKAEALKWYQHFKSEIVAKLEPDFELPEKVVRDWIELHRMEADDV